ncbi:MAG: 50S ribosomal protein L25 [Patescibacteria group bacterium]|jgi:large subunit ribosomal protein L25
MDKLLLEAQKRTEKEKTLAALRKSGFIPAIVYGHDREQATMLSISYPVFERMYKKAGHSSLIDLQVTDSQPVKVLIQQVQTDPLTGKFIHIDFHQVKLSEKLEVDILLNYIGESKAVKELGGVLVKTLDHVHAECLAKDLVHEIDFDISSLQSFEDAIRVSDLHVPAGVTIKQNADEVVATVQPPRSEAEMKELEAVPEAAVDQVEVAEKGKKPVEGEDAAEADAKATPSADAKK